LLAIVFRSWKKRSPDSREIITHSALAFITKTIGVLLGLILNILIARRLGIENSGYYFLGLTVVSILSVLGRAGLDQTILRYVGRAHERADWGLINDLRNKALILGGVSSLIIAMLLWVFSDWFSANVFERSEMSSVLRMFSPAIVGLSLLTLVGITLQGMRKTVVSSIALNVSTNAIVITSLFFFAVDQPSVMAFLYSGGVWVAFFIVLFFLRKGQRASAGIIEWDVIFQSCFPLLIVNVMNQVVLWSGQLIAGAWVSPEELAQLSVAIRVSMLSSFVLMAVNFVVAPRYAAMYADGDLLKLERMARLSVRIMVMLVSPVVVILFLFPGHVMGLFGEGFAEGSYLLQILIVGQFINVATGSVGYLLSMSGHEKDLRNMRLVLGPFSICLALVLVPAYGVTGCAIATAFSVALQNLILVWYVKKRLGFNTLAVWRRIK